MSVQVKKDKEDLTKQWGTTGILGTLEGHARGIQASLAPAAPHTRLYMLTGWPRVSAPSIGTPIVRMIIRIPPERCRESAAGFPACIAATLCETAFLQRTKDGEVKMVTVMLIGQPDCCEKARALIDEAIDNKEEKAKQRQKEYAKKRDAKVRPARERSCTTLPAEAFCRARTLSRPRWGTLRWCVGLCLPVNARVRSCSGNDTRIFPQVCEFDSLCIQCPSLLAWRV